jgi:hypothetical protein
MKINTLYVFSLKCPEKLYVTTHTVRAAKYLAKRSFVLALPNRERLQSVATKCKQATPAKVVLCNLAKLHRDFKHRLFGSEVGVFKLEKLKTWPSV